MIRKSYFFLKIKKLIRRKKRSPRAKDSVCKSPYFSNTFLGIFSFTLHSSASVYSALQMGKQRPGEGPLLAQGHTASKRQGWGLKKQVSMAKVKERPWVGERAGLGAAKQGRGRRGRGWEEKPGSWELGSLSWSQGINMCVQAPPTPSPP